MNPLSARINDRQDGMAMKKRFAMTNISGVAVTATMPAIYSSLLLWGVLGAVGILLFDLSPAAGLLGGLIGMLLHWAGELAHQLGHAAAARRVGYPMREIRCLFLLAASRYPRDEPPLPAEIHIRRALGGAPVNFGLALLGLIPVLLLRGSGGAAYLLAAFLLPGEPAGFRPGRLSAAGLHGREHAANLVAAPRTTIAKSSDPMPRFRHIDVAIIVEKIDQLEQRIRERFPERNLSRVCHTLYETALDTQNRLAFIARPNWWLRITIAVLVLLVLVGTVALATNLAVVDDRLTLTELLAAVEAGLNDLLLISAAIVFLITLETRVKRRRTLDALHELRSLAHVIDMHQLTKDPTRLLLSRADTPSSPQEALIGLSAAALPRLLQRDAVADRQGRGALRAGLPRSGGGQRRQRHRGADHRPVAQDLAEDHDHP